MFYRVYEKLKFFSDTQVFNKLEKYTHRLKFFINKHSRILISVLIAFAISDLLLMGGYHFLIPKKELPPLNVRYSDKEEAFSADRYKIVWENNIFHTGPIPSELKTENKSAEPVLSSLPFTLKGTIIHANPGRSVASVKSRLAG